MKDEIKNALRLARAFGGYAYSGNNIASGMDSGGPMPPTPNPMGMMQGQPMNNQPGNPMNSFGQQTQNGIDGDPIRDMGYTSPPPFATLDNNLPPPQPVQAPVPSSYNPLMSNTPPAPMADGGAVEEALEKTQGEHAIPFHQEIARSGYEDGGHVSDAEIQELLDFPLHHYAEGGEVEGEVSAAPDDISTENFLHKELEGSAPQYDPEGGLNTAREGARFAAGLTTPGAIADAAGYLGGPSVLENIGQGNYGTAALQAAGTIPFVGPLAKMGAGAHLAMSMVPKSRAVEDALSLANRTIPDKERMMLTHSLDAEKFPKVVELGGHPNPSLGISKPLTNFEVGKFGDTHFVAPENMLDFNRDMVFNRDAWTPTFPEIKNGKFVNRKGKTKAANLKNISEHMSSDYIDDILGAEGFDNNFDAFNSLADTFYDKEHMLRNRNRLVSPKEYDKAYNPVRNKLEKITDNLADYDESFGYDIPYAFKNRDFSVFKDQGAPRSLINRAQKIIDQIENLPAKYFEAKIQRPVLIKDWVGAAVPVAEERAIGPVLKKANVPYETYSHSRDDVAKLLMERFKQHSFEKGGKVKNKTRKGH